MPKPIPKKKTAPAKSRKPARFRLTYATMFDPPEELHRSFERALGFLVAQERLAGKEALADLCLALLNRNEFLYSR